MRKYAKYAGADNSTPSIPQYFSWINNTNEGSTEEQTLINLDFFKWIKEKYGMQIKIYAWDAGNFDGAGNGYGKVDSPKIKAQYPEGYKNIVEKAAEIGIQMGLWGGPDGFGNTEEEQKERFDFYVHLCRDYKFGLFKLDGVCGALREEKAEVFADLLKECRKYCPDLIVLNHRLNLYQAEKYVTTFLWNGQETYTDVLSANEITAMHNRAYMFSRGHVKNLQHLAEDHGVCVSSSLDYFEDELVYQAFNRSLILAPELYGNPWFLKDKEYPRLARIYNYHKHNSQYLLKGKLLPKSYGAEAVSRGNGEKRFISTGNDTWNTKKISIRLDEEIGIKTDEKILVNVRHPYNEFLGEFSYGDTVEIEMLPFRAYLFEIATESLTNPYLTNCKYDVIVEDDDGKILEADILYSEGNDISQVVNGNTEHFCTVEKVDKLEKAPEFLGSLNEKIDNPENGEFLYETAMFGILNDSLEKRCIDRSGDTNIPQVKKCRDAFFSQETYKLRGCEMRNIFDGNEDTFYDGQSKRYQGGIRTEGGCLRLDCGKIIDADEIKIEFFMPDKPTDEVPVQDIPSHCECSADLKSWEFYPLDYSGIVYRDYTQRVVKFRVHSIYELQGKKITVIYKTNCKFRYLRMEAPMERIFSIKAFKNGKEIQFENPKVNNLQAHYKYRGVRMSHSGEVTLPDVKKGDFIAVAVNGKHGIESAYCCAEIEGDFCGFPRRAPDYKANMWEHKVMSVDKNNTFFLPINGDMSGKKVKVYVTLSDNKNIDVSCDVYLCHEHQ